MTVLTIPLLIRGLLFDLACPAKTGLKIGSAILSSDLPPIRAGRRVLFPPIPIGERLASKRLIKSADLVSLARSLAARARRLLFKTIFFGYSK